MTTVVDPCSDVAAGEHLPGDLVDDLERVVRTREDALPHLGDSLRGERAPGLCRHGPARVGDLDLVAAPLCRCGALRRLRSEEHTSELQSRENIVCRLLLEKQ